jgi:hypothetical protein
MWTFDAEEAKNLEAEVWRHGEESYTDVMFEDQ